MKKKDRRIMELEQEVRALRGRLDATTAAAQDKLDVKEEEHRQKVLETARQYEDADLSLRRNLVNLALGIRDENTFPSANAVVQVPTSNPNRESALLIEVRGIIVGAVPILEWRIDPSTDPTREPPLEVSIPRYAVRTRHKVPR